MVGNTVVTKQSDLAQTHTCKQHEKTGEVMQYWHNISNKLPTRSLTENWHKEEAMNCLRLTFTGTEVQLDHWGQPAVPVELKDRWKIRSLDVV